ncbi:MAG: hypothetical protein NVS3B1_02920 [Marmoricola sp.]
MTLVSRRDVAPEWDFVPRGKAPHYDTSYGPSCGATYGSVQVTAGRAEELIDRVLNAATVLKAPVLRAGPELRGAEQ